MTILVILNGTHLGCRSAAVSSQTWHVPSSSWPVWWWEIVLVSRSGAQVITSFSSVGSEWCTPPLGAGSGSVASSDTGSVRLGRRLSGGDGGNAVHGQCLLSPSHSISASSYLISRGYPLEREVLSVVVCQAAHAWQGEDVGGGGWALEVSWWCWLGRIQTSSHQTGSAAIHPHTALQPSTRERGEGGRVGVVWHGGHHQVGGGHAETGVAHIILWQTAGEAILELKQNKNEEWMIGSNLTKMCPDWKSDIWNVWNVKLEQLRKQSQNCIIIQSYLILILLLCIFRNEIFNFFLPPLLPVLAKVVVVGELNIFIIDVWQSTTRHWFLVSYWSPGAAGSSSSTTLWYLKYNGMQFSRFILQYLKLILYFFYVLLAIDGAQGINGWNCF